MFFEEWSFHPSEAASIVGVTADQVDNWFNRYDLIPERQRGKGVPVRYGVRDLLQFAVVKALCDLGIAPAKAAAALRTYPAYGTLLNGGGTAIFTRGPDGGLIGAYRSDDGADVQIQISLWPIFDRIYAAAKPCVLRSPDRYNRPVEEIRRLIDEGEIQIRHHRKIQGA
jgi:DNA-binding transcriptional MerR regulator